MKKQPREKEGLGKMQTNQITTDKMHISSIFSEAQPSYWTPPHFFSS